MAAPRLAPDVHIQNAVIVHFLTRLAATALEEQPFPHFFVENVFPEDIYDDLQRLMIASEMMEPLTRHQKADGTQTRFQFPLNPPDLARLSGPQRALWEGVTHGLDSPQVKQAVFAKLAPGLALRYGKSAAEAAKTPAVPRTLLMRETEGYYIAPHPDTRKKIVTMQFALPVDDSQADLGTTFYQLSLSPADLLRTPRGFRRAKQMPFRRNCCYAFVVLNNLTKRSWHGREALTQSQGVRNSLLHLYYDPAAVSSGSGYE